MLENFLGGVLASLAVLAAIGWVALVLWLISLASILSIIGALILFCVGMGFMTMIFDER